MSDPLRTDLPHALDGVSDSDRDAKIEQLLIVGLDHYFAGEYEHAINVWTRALFLDRSHARARAYIERARSALAERHRETDELLQSGLAAFERGQTDEARRLLQSAISRGAPTDEALAVLDRLNRLEQSAASVSSATVAPTRPAAMAPQVAAPTRSRLTILWVATACVLVVAAALFAWRSRLDARARSALTVFDVLGVLDNGAAEPASSPEPAIPELALPRRGEAALTRARALQVSGHLHDALTALDAVRLTDPQRPDADRLRADIERQLIALASATTPGRLP